MQPISVPVNGSKVSDTSDSQRGIHYAESLDYGKVCYPDPEKVKRFHREWEGVTGYLNEWEMDCD